MAGATDASTRSGPTDQVLGLDEAGRGSLIGPLVIGGYLVERRRLDGLAALGARDSKLLSPGQREAAYSRLASTGRCFALFLPPRLIDARVRRHGLNRLEAEGFAQLIRATRPSEVFADACDVDSRRFGAILARLSGASATIRASHRADREFPVVGAASIIAKTCRDHAVTHLAQSIGCEIGSGYPSDGTTIQFVRQFMGEVGGAGSPAPLWLRRSWSTMECDRELGLLT